MPVSAAGPSMKVISSGCSRPKPRRRGKCFKNVVSVPAPFVMLIQLMPWIKRKLATSRTLPTTPQ